jgi:predicted transcriptional regulator
MKIWIIFPRLRKKLALHSCFAVMIGGAPSVISWIASSMNTPLDSEIIPARVRLGPLERRILAEVWSRKSLTVRELLKDGKVQLAYTTVMTTLDRLFKKGLLDRTEEGRAFRYYATCPPDEVARWAAVAGVRRWIESVYPSSLPLSYFVEAIGTHDALLDELRDLVERKRTELKKQKGKQP